MFLKAFALLLIRGYQKFISPYKGFSCALRVYGGGHSCSRFGYDAINRHGFFLGLKLLRRRTAKCSWHAHQHSLLHTKPAIVPSMATPRQYSAVSPAKMSTFGNPVLRHKHQGGFVDCDVSGCDAPSCDVPSCDMPSCDMPSCEMPHCDLPNCDAPSCESHGAGRVTNIGGEVCDSLAWGCGDTSGCNSRDCRKPSCCGSESGYVREQRRLDEIRKRRGKKQGDTSQDEEVISEENED